MEEGKRETEAPESTRREREGLGRDDEVLATCLGACVSSGNPQ